MGKQNGAVMIAGLVILLVLGVIGTGSLNHVNIMERMVSNIHDANRAFQGAEAAINFCEDFLDGLTVAYTDELMVDEIHQDDDEDDVIKAWADTAEPDDHWWLDWAFWADNGVDMSALGFSSSDRPGRISAEPSCYRQRIVGKKTMQQDVDGEDTDVETNQAAFETRYENTENLMADQSGDAARSGGIFHFRVTGASAGLAVRGDGQGRSRAVTQSDFFKRLN